MHSFESARKRLRATSSSLLTLFMLSLVWLAAGCGGTLNTNGGTTPPPTPPTTSTPSTANEWTWEGGSSTPSTVTNVQPGTYGSKGVAASGNTPGARTYAASWTDSSGNLWLFGGDAYDGLGNLGILNDLWEFNLTSKEWTWVSGADQAASKLGGTAGLYGVYGTQGAPATANVPGAREGAASWIDSSGNLWLFGGQGYDSGGLNGFLNDLWEFSPASKEWTWVSGSNAVSAANGNQVGVYGIYGTQGTGSPTNVPGGRSNAASWIDGSGNLWLFGGIGFAAIGPYGSLNDLWKFNPSSRTWTWISGSNTLGTYLGQFGVYGALGVAAATNVPGGRLSAVTWIDGSGNLWLFGGDGYDSTGKDGYLNDLWEFSPSSKQWIWISGSSSEGANASEPGVYGTLGVAASTNTPGGKQGAVGWIDGSGNLWLFGGINASGNFNDLWEFSPTSKEWTWVSGASSVGTSEAATGVYGTLGVASATNVPEGRSGGVSWIDSSGNLWLFGGTNLYGYNGGGDLNDLWRYQP